MLLRNLKLKNMKLAMTEGIYLDVDENGLVNVERIEDIKALRMLGFVDVEMVRQDMRIPEMPAVKTFKRRKKQ